MRGGKTRQRATWGRRESEMVAAGRGLRVVGTDQGVLGMT